MASYDCYQLRGRGGRRAHKRATNRAWAQHRLVSATGCGLRAELRELLLTQRPRSYSAGEPQRFDLVQSCELAGMPDTPVLPTNAEDACYDERFCWAAALTPRPEESDPQPIHTPRHASPEGRGGAADAADGVPSTLWAKTGSPEGVHTPLLREQALAMTPFTDRVCWLTATCSGGSHREDLGSVARATHAATEHSAEMPAELLDFSDEEAPSAAQPRRTSNPSRCRSCPVAAGHVLRLSNCFRETSSQEPEPEESADVGAATPQSSNATDSAPDTFGGCCGDELRDCLLRQRELMANPTVLRRERSWTWAGEGPLEDEPALTPRLASVRDEELLGKLRRRRESSEAKVDLGDGQSRPGCKVGGA